ncbi:hypothetical protein Psta_2866 [Pirellula staleyi DSM 6068]|uniref:Uncharacterized protein n=1 Tax=Pirellula staleyi (strain ATCC 27377 / DSM 6068 / ICPB 4128) TaxID=530564 RepID=D2R8J0_PIRSD|nr:hypothetical protein [Pirellula staleyi]ADB17531.1 hypothetical protein Psta_2866 [Pirellula staleyi DSM 6068]
MTWLFDSPTTIVLWSVVLAIAAGVAWTFTGKRIFAVLTGLIVLTAAGLLIAEKVIITDREAIEIKLKEIADDLAANRQAAVVANIAASNIKLQQVAKSELPNYQFTSLRITKIHSIEIDSAPKNRTARVEFNIVAEGTFKVGDDQISGMKVPRLIKVDMLKEEDGVWRVDNYSHAAPQEFLFQVPGSEGMTP